MLKKKEVIKMIAIIIILLIITLVVVFSEIYNRKHDNFEIIDNLVSEYDYFPQEDMITPISYAGELKGIECVGETIGGRKLYKKTYSDSYKDPAGCLHRNLIEIYEEDYEKDILKGYVPTNCKNCGAPLHSHECEYCGSEYY